MKNTYVNRLMMWRSLHHYLAGKDPVWNSNEPFSSAVSKLAKEITAANAILDMQSLSITLATDRRKLRFNTLFEKVKAISNSATAYALATGNEELRKLVRLSQNRLQSTRLLAQISIFRGVLIAAEPYIAALAPYGIGTTEMAEAHAALRDFNTEVVGPNHQLRNRVAVLSAIPEIFRRGQNAILEMDNLIYLFEKTAPDFVAAFRSHRKVNNRIGRHKSGEGGDAEAA